MSQHVEIELVGRGTDWAVKANGEQLLRGSLTTLRAVCGVIVAQLDAALTANPHLDRRQ